MLTTVSAVQTINDKFKSILKKYFMQVTFDEIFIKSVLLLTPTTKSETTNPEF